MGRILQILAAAGAAVCGYFMWSDLLLHMVWLMPLVGMMAAAGDFLRREMGYFPSLCGRLLVFPAAFLAHAASVLPDLGRSAFLPETDLLSFLLLALFCGLAVMGMLLIWALTGLFERRQYGEHRAWLVLRRGVFFVVTLALVVGIAAPVDYVFGNSVSAMIYRDRLDDWAAENLDTARYELGEYEYSGWDGCRYFYRVTDRATGREELLQYRLDRDMDEKIYFSGNRRLKENALGVG